MKKDKKERLKFDRRKQVEFIEQGTSLVLISEFRILRNKIDVLYIFILEKSIEKFLKCALLLSEKREF